MLLARRSLAVALVFVCGWGIWSRGTEAAPAAPRTSPAYRNAAPNVAYVGSKACAQCHQDIYDQFERTGMGSSMSSGSDASQLARVGAPVNLFDETINRHFSIYRKGSGLYQSEYETDASGKKVFEQEYRLAYAVGAGEAGYSYLVERGDILFQAPLSFYSRTQSWELSPGYEHRDQGFSRPIYLQCIVCHAGRPAPAAGTARPSSPFQTDPFVASNPPFTELAIGCENCHGPGALHVKERKAGARLSGTIDTAIVNPAKLPPELASNICMPCHQAGDARVLRPGKTLADFRPGTPLAQTLMIFQIPLSEGAPTPSPLLGHYFAMRLSECYAKSGGRLGCTTCHDPHREPKGAEAASFYRSKCLTCHNQKSCTLPMPSRLATQPPDDCIGCHMPKQNLTAVSHAVLTDHRIAARPGEPYPDWAFHLTTPGLPDLIQADAFGGQADRLPAITLFDAYAQLAPSHPDAYLNRYLETMLDAERENPDDSFLLSALAQRALAGHKADAKEQAIRYLSRAVELGSRYPADYLRLGELLREESETSESIRVLNRGMSLAPFDDSFYGMIASEYLSSGDKADAAEVLKRGLEELPEDDSLRALAGQVETTSPSQPVR
jgi:hypothetical protein